MKGLTVLVVAHRLSTVREADLIIVLEAGQLVESGTHAKLVARQGRYTQLLGGAAQDIRARCVRLRQIWRQA